MENATKALLIAAAILIAILIISLSLVVYNMASQTLDGLNMTEAEITAFNDKFLQYEGTSVTGSSVKAMLRTVESNNISNQDSKGKQVTVYSDAAASDANQITSSSSIDTGKRYTVTCIKDTNSGLVTKITAVEKK